MHLLWKYSLEDNHVITTEGTIDHGDTKVDQENVNVNKQTPLTYQFHQRRQHKLPKQHEQTK